MLNSGHDGENTAKNARVLLDNRGKIGYICNICLPLIAIS